MRQLRANFVSVLCRKNSMTEDRPQIHFIIFSNYLSSNNLKIFVWRCFGAYAIFRQYRAGRDFYINS